MTISILAGQKINHMYRRDEGDGSTKLNSKRFLIHIIISPEREPGWVFKPQTYHEEPPAPAHPPPLLHLYHLASQDWCRGVTFLQQLPNHAETNQPTKRSVTCPVCQLTVPPRQEIYCRSVCRWDKLLIYWSQYTVRLLTRLTEMSH